MIFLTLLLLSGFSFAENCKSSDQALTECCEFVKSMHHTKVSRLLTLDKVCTMSVYTGNVDSSFRRFGFASDGQVSVFMQPGGNKMKSNSSQSFLIYPFGRLPTGEFNSDEQLIVKSGSGQKWTFNTQSSLPSSLEGCKLSVNSKFSLQDSGFKIQSCKNHLVIETPVEVGGEAIAYPDRLLTIRDPAQNTCQVKATELYEYKKNSGSYMDKLGRYYSMKMKYKSNRDMGLNLQKLCPGLNVSMLLQSTPEPALRKTDPSDEKRARDILDAETNN